MYGVYCSGIFTHSRGRGDCLFQTLQLGQNDPNILREIATAFISMDKLQTAEDLIHHTMSIETMKNKGVSPSG